MLAVLGIFSVLTFIIYSNTFSSPFVLDDFKVIAENSAMQTNAIFTNVNLHRYVGTASFALNYRISKLNTFSYHLTNSIIHILNAFLVFVLFRKIYAYVRNEPINNSTNLISFAIALIFLVHPIQTQAVTYIVQRYTSLAALFALVSLLSYFHFRTSAPPRYIFFCISVVSALLAYKTKENTATILLMLIVMELLLFKGTTLSVKKRIVLVLPFVLLVAVIPAAFLNLHQMAEKSLSSLMSELKESSMETPQISRSQYLVTEMSVIVLYMRLLVLPMHQSMHYLYPFTHSFFQLKTFLSFCLIMAVLVSAVILAKKYKEISFGIGWFFIFLLVESSIIPIQDAVFEHRLYLPSIGFISAGVVILFQILRKFNIRIFLGVIVLISVLLSAATYVRNEVWHDEITLWKSVLARFPQNYIAHSSLGSGYAKMKKWDEAIKELNVAIKINPEFAPSYNNLAISYTYTNRSEDAMKSYHKAIEVRPDYVKAYYNLASLYYQQRNLQEAFLLLNRAKTFNDKHPMVNNQLGRLYCQMGNYEKSFALLNEALSVEPDNTNIHYNMGICFMKSGKTHEARSHFFEILELDTHDYECYYFIGLSYEKEKNVAEAVNYYRLFISKSPDETANVRDAKSRLSALGGLVK